MTRTEPIFWTSDADARLRALWAEGHSTAEIGVRLNRSRNAIVGRAHRLGCAGRPSPIKRKVSGELTRAAKRPPLPVGVQPPLPSAALEVAMTSPSPVALIAEPSHPLPRPAPPVTRSKCCWPMWRHTERATHVYCGAPAVLGKPYCRPHLAVAFGRSPGALYAG